MINILNKQNKLSETRDSINVTYPRTVNIIHGHYPYPEIIHDFILQIKNNLNDDMNNYTNVKGGMTKWDYFLDKKNFIDFTSFIINKHQVTHGDIFEYFFEKFIFMNAWGNEIKLGDSLNYHHHNCIHGILYLTDGCDLILPELNLKITPKLGDYYIFPPLISHGFNPSVLDTNRYSLVFNIENKCNNFDYFKKNLIKEYKKNDRKNR